MFENVSSLCRFLRLEIVVIVSVGAMITACGNDAATATAAPTASAPATTPAAGATAPAPAPAPAPHDRLLGRWEEVQEFGGGTCRSLDCVADRPAGERGTIEFRPGAYVRQFPSTSRPMEGAWQVANAEGETLTISMTLQLGEMAIPSDPQTIVFRDANTFEMRNSENRQGGVYHRIAQP